MEKIEQRISPSGFARLNQTLVTAEMQGHGPDACAAIALQSVGLSATPFVEVVFIVDYDLDGSVYPFF